VATTEVTTEAVSVVAATAEDTTAVAVAITRVGRSVSVSRCAKSPMNRIWSGPS
jgi:hypothetical protein